MESHDVDRFRGLDMSHGFIKSIVKNQIDRDEYHKVMEERKIEVQKKIRESKRRKPAGEYKLYVPPHLRAKNEAADANKKSMPDRRNPCPAIVRKASAPASIPPRPVFLLNLKKNSGDTVDIAVMNTDNAARLAKELGRKHGFTDDQCRMLRLTLERELEARLAP
ncbi:hypothetical protein OESDEN_07491 [Oesophagostomum dentatum]|uniref:Uncharacterized protein n=1 Tax=Oesophagostomum dentatum TaxID=61180 RepID=A0A0B1T5W2_OESDE|nr:hypothetical protein OESDEN_07491 [Oesophagostomum dentatum]